MWDTGRVEIFVHDTSVRVVWLFFRDEGTPRHQHFYGLRARRWVRLDVERGGCPSRCASGRAREEEILQESGSSNSGLAFRDKQRCHLRRDVAGGMPSSSTLSQLRRRRPLLAHGWLPLSAAHGTLPRCAASCTAAALSAAAIRAHCYASADDPLPAAASIGRPSICLSTSAAHRGRRQYIIGRFCS